MTIQPDTPAILLLGASEQLAVLEKRALRDMGVTQLVFMTSGLDAARFLAASPPEVLPDVIVCAQKLRDMDGDNFCSLLRLHSRLKDLPTLLVLSSDSEVEHCKTLGFSASALLGRPYSAEDLKKIVLSLAATRSRADAAGTESIAPVEDAAEEFGKALAASARRQERRPEDYYRVGRRSLQEGRWNDAIEAFQAALRDGRLKGEAELGLASAWKNKGDMAQCGRSLASAADDFVGAGQWKRARAVYARLLREHPSAKNPFLARAQQALRQGRHADAAKYLAEGLDLTPEAHIRDKMAQICLACEAPEAMLQGLESALTAVMSERGRRLAGGIRGEFRKLHGKREDWRREAEAARRHKVSLLMEREDATDRDAGSGMPPRDTGRDAVPRRDAGLMDVQSEANLDWREVTSPLNALGNAGGSGEFAGGNDLISIIKYTWRLARNRL
ncbi:MAG: histidine kinase [Desulfovibrio sp.]|jgi:tetratricopeptide (TPR) repeat protein|nr:histidine kinase [Desulfovibrio sp.]